MQRLDKCRVFVEYSTTRVKTHKLLQVCKQIVTNLFTSCQQVVFARLVPSLLQQVWNKLLTTCNKLDGIIRPVTSCSNKSATIMIKQECYKVDNTRL